MKIPENEKISASKSENGTGKAYMKSTTRYQTDRENAAYKFGLLDFITNIAKGKTKNEFTAARVLDVLNKALEKANAANGTNYKPFTTEKQAIYYIELEFNLLEPKQERKGSKRGKMLHSFDLTNLRKPKN